jgi:hypothetical protein
MRATFIGLSFAVLAGLGCGDDGDGNGDTSATPDAADSASAVDSASAPDSVADSAPDTAPDTQAEDVATNDDTASDTAVAETAEPARVEEDCAEEGYAACFINDDCPAPERCQNMSANEVEIPCCVPGARGTLPAGEPCTGENDCATSLCISYNDGPFLCSAPCDGGPDGCPSAAPACIFGLCVPGD